MNPIKMRSQAGPDIVLIRPGEPAKNKYYETNLHAKSADFLESTDCRQVDFTPAEFPVHLCACCVLD
jgi:hypothetical protein